MRIGKETYWRLTIGSWIYLDGVTLDKAQHVQSRLEGVVRHVRVEQLHTVEEMTG